MKKIIFLKIFLFFILVSYSQVDFDVKFEKNTQLHKINLDKLPKTRAKIIGSLIKGGLSYANEYTNQQEIGIELEKFLKKIDKEFPKDFGILVKINYYTQKEGSNSFLYPDKFQPLSMGNTPEDALSEYYNKDYIIKSASNKSSLTESNRTYLWIYKNSRNEILMGEVPFTKDFERKSRIIADKKVKDSNFIMHLSEKNEYKANDVALYWNKKLIKHQELVRSKGIFNEIESSNSQYALLQRKFELTYNKIKTLEKRISTNNSFYNYFLLFTKINDVLPVPRIEYNLRANSENKTMKNQLASLNNELNDLKAQLTRKDILLKRYFDRVYKIEYLDKPPIGIIPH